MTYIRPLLVTALLLICFIRKTEQRLLKRTTEIINEEKPIMHTYIDNSDRYIEDELLQLWMDAWSKAGWIIKVLDVDDAAKHPKYNEYMKLLDDLGICCLPRQTYLRSLAMSTIPFGGFYSDAYVVPLHKLSEITDGNTLLSGQLPNEGKMTIYDGVIGSIFSGEQKEWDRLISIVFANLEKNMSLSLLKIKSENPDIFDFRSDEMYDNFVKSSDDVCVKAEDKFVIRFHSSEMQLNGFEAQSREFIIKSWYENYKQKCWIR